MVAATAPVFFFRHRGNQVFCFLKGFLHRFLANETYEELVIERKRALLRDLISCVDCDDCGGGTDVFDEDLAQFCRVARRKNDDVDVDFFALQIGQQPIFVVLVDQVGVIRIFKAEEASLVAHFVRLEHAVTHNDKHSRVLAQNVVERLEVEYPFVDSQLLVLLLHCFDDVLEHDIWLDNLSVRQRNELVFGVL